MRQLSISRRGIVGLAAGGSILLLAGGIYLAWLITPPGLPQTPAEALRTIASARYERLPDYRRREYLDATARLMRDMAPEQRRELFQRMRTDEEVRSALREVRENQMMQRMVELAALPEAERAARIREMVERFRARRPPSDGDRPPRTRGDGGEAGPTDRGRRWDPGRMRERIEGWIQEGNPQTRALMMEMRRAMREAREESGDSRPRR